MRRRTPIAYAGAIAMTLAGCAPARLASVAYVAPPPPRDDASGFEAIAGALAVLRAPSPAAPRRAPILLTRSNDREVPLASLRARATIDGPLAVTELELSFANASRNEHTGTLVLSLPAGAALDGLSVYTDDAWRDGEVVAQRPPQRPEAPEPLEPGGSAVRASVVIEQGEPVRVRARYTQELGASRPYRLALAGLPAVADVDVEITGGAEVVTLHGPALAPADVVVPVAGSDALVAGDAVVVRVAPALARSTDPVAELVILVDTSASRAALLRDQARAIRALLGVLLARGLTRVEVAAFDQSVAPLDAGAPAAVAAAIEDHLVARGAFGASDLGGALAWASERGARTLIVGDGVATAGARSPRAIGKRVRGVPRIDALVIGGTGDRTVLAAAVGRGERPGAIIVDHEPGAEAWADRLERPALADVPISIDGASWVWPERVGSVQDGDDVLVLARLLPGARTDELTVRLGAETATVVARPGPAALVDRAVAAADIARRERELEALADDAQRVAAVGELVALAAQHRILSGRTAMRLGDHAVEVVAGAPALDDVYAVDFTTNRFLLDGPIPRAIDLVAMRAGAPPVEVRFDPPNPNGIQVVLADYDKDLASGRITPTTKWDGVRQGRPELNGPQDGTDFRGPRLPLGWDEAHHQDEYFVPRRPEAPVGGRPAWSGRFADTTAAIAAGDHDRAVVDAIAWQAEAPDEVLPLVALGEALEARGNGALAARAYGSILDRFPDRPDAARIAGERLERVGDLRLAITAYRRAVEHDALGAASHRLLGWALARDGDLDGALAAIEAGYVNARHIAPLTAHVLREDFAAIAGAIAQRAPDRRAELERRGFAAQALVEAPATVRFVLHWDGATDVDLHVVDRRGNRAWEERPELGYFGLLVGDMEGAQPEQFTLPLADAHQGPYRLAAWIDYTKEVLGTLQIIEYDGRGGFTFDERPFVATEGYSYVDLGTWE